MTFENIQRLLLPAMSSHDSLTCKQRFATIKANEEILTMGI
jgi:hypothetical protein